MSKPNDNETVRALKNDAKWVKKISWVNALTPGSAEFLAVSERITGAADLIESMQAQLTKYDEVAAEYGIDGKTMLTLAKSQIKTAQDNIKLQEQLAESQRKTQGARNELCQQCGRYHEAHNGACDGCRWKE